MKEKKQEQNNTTLMDLNKISRGTTFTGDITSDGDFRIDGILNGNIITAGRIVVGEKATVTGDIKCANAEIEGLVTGAVRVDDILSVKSTGVIKGTIVTSRMAVELGAKLEVESCQMNKTSVNNG